MWDPDNLHQLFYSIMHDLKIHPQNMTAVELATTTARVLYLHYKRNPEFVKNSTRLSLLMCFFLLFYIIYYKMTKLRVPCKRRLKHLILGRTPSHFVAQNGYVVLDDVLRQYEHVRDVLGNTPLHLCAQSGHVEIGAIFVKNGAEINAKSGIFRHGKTPLQIAAENGNAEFVRMLIASGASVDVQGLDKKTALHLASEKGCGRVVDALLEARACVKLKDSMGRTALHYSAEKGHGDILRALLDAGASPNIRDSDGKTALHYAAINGHNETVLVLVKVTDFIDTGDNSDKTALHSSSQRGHTEVVKTLLEAGAGVDVRDVLGKTPLHYSAGSNAVDVMRLLLPRVGDVDVTDNCGVTPLDEARKQNHDDAVAVLRGRGAKGSCDNQGGKKTSIGAFKCRWKFPKIFILRNYPEFRIKRSTESKWKIPNLFPTKKSSTTKTHKTQPKSSSGRCPKLPCRLPLNDNSTVIPLGLDSPFSFYGDESPHSTPFYHDSARCSRLDKDNVFLSMPFDTGTSAYFDTGTRTPVDDGGLLLCDLHTSSEVEVIGGNTMIGSSQIRPINTSRSGPSGKRQKRRIKTRHSKSTKKCQSPPLDETVLNITDHGPISMKYDHSSVADVQHHDNNCPATLPDTAVTNYQNKISTTSNMAMYVQGTDKTGHRIDSIGQRETGVPAGSTGAQVSGQVVAGDVLDGVVKGNNQVTCPMEGEDGSTECGETWRKENTREFSSADQDCLCYGNHLENQQFKVQRSPNRFVLYKFRLRQRRRSVYKSSLARSIDNQMANNFRFTKRGRILCRSKLRNEENALRNNIPSGNAKTGGCKLVDGCSAGYLKTNTRLTRKQLTANKQELHNQNTDKKTINKTKQKDTENQKKNSTTADSMNVGYFGFVKENKPTRTGSLTDTDGCIPVLAVQNLIECCLSTATNKKTGKQKASRIGKNIVTFQLKYSPNIIHHCNELHVENVKYLATDSNQNIFIGHV
ncbi:uncharacterized protein LOC131949487 [Physella acuta]|uniref:uncharacterized protein LOC131949487 n=1 Tax=Physella acuta TaxID=109671 RepID=UPI0027DE7134|nr:uncharacterized protein LOC131949487 [Physella acuta]